MNAVAHHCVQRLAAYLQQSLPADAHEISPYVHFQHIAWTGVVTALLKDMLFQPLYSVMCATPLDAGVAVLNEGMLKKWIGVVIEQMVDYAVTELRGYYLAFLRVFNDKAGAGLGGVGVGKKFLAEIFQLPVHVALKLLLVCFAAFMPSGIKVCLMKVEVQLVTGECVWHGEVNRKKDAPPNVALFFTQRKFVGKC